MTTVQNSHIRNGLLAALAPDDLALLAPHLREVLLLPGDLLHQPGEKIEQVYFLQNGIVSLMAVLEEGTSVETVSIGREGAIGTIEGFGSLHAFTSARVQLPGSALRMPGPMFRRMLDDSAKLKESINHYHMSVMAHVQQITACNALHDLISRLSRVLLLSADRCADDIQLSQEALAEMLGVRRSSVTTAALPPPCCVTPAQSTIVGPSSKYWTAKSCRRWCASVTRRFVAPSTWDSSAPAQ